MEYDLLNLPYYQELKAHKLRRTVPAPNSYFFNLICKNCKQVKKCFSHGQSKVECIKCNTVLAIPSGGKLKISYEFALAENINNANKKISKAERKEQEKQVSKK